MSIWSELVRSVPHCTTGSWFKMPQGVVRKAICKESGQLANEGSCPQCDEVFLESRMPSGTCSIHHAAFMQKIKNFINPL